MSISIRPISLLWIGWVSVLLVAGAGRAQSAGATDGKSLIWEISGNGLAAPSYLFGTLHIICKDEFLWTPAMANALDRSQKVCFEMKMDDPELITGIRAAMMDTNGKTIKDYYSLDDYNTVKHYFKDSLGIDLFLFAHMRPFVLQTMLSSKIRDCRHPVSYEDSIMQIALKTDKLVFGLEQPEEQLAVIAGTPDSAVAASLLETAKNKGSVDPGYDSLLSAYLQQDLPLLYRQIMSSGTSEHELDELLNDRNSRWIGRMEKYMTAGPTFFAVGAGHLWGEKGVLALLRAKGYRVRALH